MRVDSRRVGWIRGERVRRGAWASLGVCTGVTLAASAVMFPIDSHAIALVGVLGVLGVTASAVGIAAASRLGSVRGRGEVRIEDGHVVATTGRRVARRALSDLEDGWIEEPRDVFLRWKDGAVLAVDAGGADEAEALLAAAGVAASHRALAVRLSSGASRVAGGVPLAVAGIALLAPAMIFMMMVAGLGAADLLATPTGVAMLGMAMIVFILGLLALLTTSLVDVLRAPEVVVGIDGIFVRRLLDARFISYRDILGVDEGSRGVVLRTVRGPVELPSWRRGGPRLDTPAGADSPAGRTRAVLADRIRDASRAGARGSASITALDRQGRPIAAWRDAVRALGRGRGAYRQAGLGPSELGEVVLDATAPAERRIAAAMALGASDDPDVRGRVRIAVESCADQDLRAALEQVAEDGLEESVLEKAIARR